MNNMSKSFKNSDDRWEYRGPKKRSKPAKFQGKDKKPKEKDLPIDFSWGHKEDNKNNENNTKQ